MATCIGEVELNMVEELDRSGLHIRVRCRNTWRAVAALRVLSLAVVLARLLGVGIRIVPQGELVVPHHKLTQLHRESREDARRAVEARRIGDER